MLVNRKRIQTVLFLKTITLLQIGIQIDITFRTDIGDVYIDIDYPNYGFRGFPRSLLTNAGRVPRLQVYLFFPHSSNSLFAYYLLLHATYE
jgi:hypothetical protein